MGLFFVTIVVHGLRVELVDPRAARGGCVEIDRAGGEARAILGPVAAVPAVEESDGPDPTHGGVGVVENREGAEPSRRRYLGVRHRQQPTRARNETTVRLVRADVHQAVAAGPCVPVEIGGRRARGPPPVQGGRAVAQVVIDEPVGVPAARVRGDIADDLDGGGAVRRHQGLEGLRGVDIDELAGERAGDERGGGVGQGRTIAGRVVTGRGRPGAGGPGRAVHDELRVAGDIAAVAHQGIDRRRPGHDDGTADADVAVRVAVEQAVDDGSARVVDEAETEGFEGVEYFRGQAGQHGLVGGAERGELVDGL